VNFLIRVAAAIIGLALAVTFVGEAPVGATLLFVFVIIALQIALARSVWSVLLRFLPILLFVTMLWLLQFLSGNRSPRLPFQASFVFASAWLLGRIVSTGRVPIPASKPVFRLYLFAYFVGHFKDILFTECRRVLTARQIAAPRLIAPGGVRSLVQAMASVLMHAVARAERFYAAQSLRGFNA